MNRALRGLAAAASALVALASCAPQPIKTGPLTVSSDFRGLDDGERRADEWAALSLTVPPEVAAELDNGDVANAWLFFFQCGRAGPDAYPAFAYLDGRIITAEALRRHRGEAVTLIFYLPRNRRASPAQRRKAGSYDCAALQSAASWPLVHSSRAFRLPANLEFRRLPPGNQPRPPSAP